MPSRHIIKQYADDSFYHIYNRGVEKRNIFLDNADYQYFLGLLERYLAPEAAVDRQQRRSVNYSAEIELIAYCLMPNHFHIFIYQHSAESMQGFMRSLCTAYSMYFNKKYKRVGSLFQGRYKAVHIQQDSYFTHISRYIHLNPLDIQKDYLSYPYSSLEAWVDISQEPAWLKPDRAKSEFSSPKEYLDFLARYKEVKNELDDIKRSLKE